MYLLKTFKGNVSENGLRCLKTSTGIYPMAEFWGDSNIVIDPLIHLACVDHEILINYANTFEYSHEKSGFITINLEVKHSEAEKVEGYLVFAQELGDELSTNAEVVFSNKGNYVLLVKSGEYFKAFGKEITFN